MLGDVGPLVALVAVLGLIVLRWRRGHRTRKVWHFRLQIDRDVHEDE